MSELPVILIADDDEKIVYAFKKTFKERARVISASDGEEAVELIRRENPTIAFTDITMPNKDGLAVLEEIRGEGNQIPIIVITGFGTMNTAIEAMKNGAFEYLTKPLDINEIRAVAERALEAADTGSSMPLIDTPAQEIKSDREIIGKHSLMQAVFKKIGTAASTPNVTNVLVTGESGTGKELVARAIHRSGKNHQQEFIGINCTALPGELLESELFGHKKGAFTGATESKKGKFEIAGKGTIFLDEIGDMSPELQNKLLRVLEEREFTSVGSHTNVPVQARFITATNQDLTGLIQSKTFREDLYFRLNVFHIHLPPLRDRLSDIPQLVEAFIQRLSNVLGKRLTGLSVETAHVLNNYHYPGNVRELYNIVTSAIAQEPGSVITKESLPTYITEQFELRGSGLDPSESLALKEARRQAIDRFEEQFIRDLLKRTGGNVSKAAEAAEITRQSFQRMMRKYGIQSADYRS